jgi:hypothetical protein
MIPFTGIPTCEDKLKSGQRLHIEDDYRFHPLTSSKFPADFKLQ